MRGERRRIEEWVAEFSLRREEGEPLDPEAFLAEHPEGGAELRSALEKLVELEALMPGGEGALPDRIGRFRVLGELGRGAMGRVLAVEDPERPGEPLALKLLHLVAGTNPRTLERFRREGEALRGVRHAGVVRVHEVGATDEAPYLLMARVEGTSLAGALARLRDGADPDVLPGPGDRFERAARVMASLARAVGALHDAGVLHRDLKPSNVLLRPDGTPVVIDFGLARVEGSETFTGTGDVVGTPQYMPPEQARGERVTSRSDVYGLGAVLWELCALEAPRRGEEALAILREAGALPLARLRRVRRETPVGLAAIVARATSFSARWRPADGGALADELEGWLAGDRAASRGPGLAQRASELWLRRRRELLSVAGLALTALVLALLLRTTGPDPGVRAERAVRGALAAWLADESDALRDSVDDLRAAAPGTEWAGFLLALAGDALPASSPDPAVDAALAAERLRRAGRLDEALEAYHVARSLASDHLAIMVPLGVCALEAGDLEDAQRTLGFCVGALGDSCDLHALLGRAFAEDGETEHALRAFATAALLCPGDETLSARVVELRKRLDRDG